MEIEPTVDEEEELIAMAVSDGALVVESCVNALQDFFADSP